MFQRHVNTEGQFVPTAGEPTGEGKTAQSAKDGQRDTQRIILENEITHDNIINQHLTGQIIHFMQY